MGIVISIQQRLARLQAQSMAAKIVADDSKAVSEIAFVAMAESGVIDEGASYHSGTLEGCGRPNSRVAAVEPAYRFRRCVLGWRKGYA